MVRSSTPFFLAPYSSLGGLTVVASDFEHQNPSYCPDLRTSRGGNCILLLVLLPFFARPSSQDGTPADVSGRTRLAYHNDLLLPNQSLLCDSASMGPKVETDVVDSFRLPDNNCRGSPPYLSCHHFELSHAV